MLRAWRFIAGDSRRAPLAVAIGLLAVAALVRFAPSAAAAAGAIYVAIVAAGLIAAVYE